MKIQESAENYLETILILQQRIGEVRSIDVVNELSYSKPSVSIAMKNLSSMNAIITQFYRKCNRFHKEFRKPLFCHVIFPFIKIFFSHRIDKRHQICYTVF